MRRILVAPHNFEIGGSQLIALELAVEVARAPGYEVELYAPRGELSERARATGLPLHDTDLRESAPSPRRIRELAGLVRRRRIDLVHAYEWAPTVDAAYGVSGLRGVPVLSTILSMDYPGFVPPAVPVVLGTRDLRERAIREGRRAHLLEPHVDTDVFDPDAVADADIARARREGGAEADGAILIVVVGRLAETLKLDGLLVLAEACGRLAASHPVHLAIIGDGPAQGRVAAAAAAANRAAGRAVVRLLGARDDPRPYYLAADVVVGMGSSALRALALRRPVIVQGERGFWRGADEHSLPLFLEQGWFGQGPGGGTVERCTAELTKLIRMSPAERAQLGRWGRRLVEGSFGLAHAGAALRDVYAEVLAAPRPTRTERAARSAALGRDILKHRTAMRMPRLQTSFRRLGGR
jgi:hypothetical protein